jgi:hypothetical protein
MSFNNITMDINNGKGVRIRMLRTIKQLDHNAKYNSEKKRITFKALTAGASAEISDAQDAETTHQSFKPVEIDKGAYRQY